MKIKVAFTLVALFLLSNLVMHPINMTVSNITHADKKMHLKIKFFADDLQSTLSIFCKTSIDFVNEGVESNDEKCIQKYVASKFEMFVNGAPVKWSYKKAYLSNEVIYVEYDAPLENPKKVKTIKVKNILQFEDFPEQKNIVNVNLLDANKVLMFDNGTEEYVKEITY